ncbi:MAG: hypothetical protein JHC90_06895, partial [Ilumatobacteraceae bacterium]|nr:hypothetical protein [Ilumatobacteraceae bacterium]
HLGNYLGALQQWVNGQHQNDVFHGIVDLHAFTVTESPGVLGQTHWNWPQCYLPWVSTQMLQRFLCKAMWLSTQHFLG